MGATVILRHSLPSGESHFDWLLEREGTPGLVTFRAAQRPDDPACTALRVERLPDHRREYLTYEGVVSGGRGTVERIASGACRVVRLGESECELVTVFPGATERRWGGRRDATGDTWHFEATDLRDRG